MTACRLAFRLLPIAAVSLLAACASRPAVQLTATQEAAQYKAKARTDYAPPGPPEDPWRPYIDEASTRFDVPDRWIREVMRVESNASQYMPSGVLTTSPVGAMGLMQLMPETYDEMRGRYDLGDDAFDPHNNILAGTAYIREMYDAFGTPGFLAAYNGGPARLQDYLTRNRSLPTETRRYVAMIGPYIEGIYPNHRSPAEQLAMNRLPIDIPAGPRFPVHRYYAAHVRHGHEGVRYASLERHRAHVRVTSGGGGAVEVAEAPPVSHHGFHLISPAYAETLPPRIAVHHGGGARVQFASAHFSAPHLSHGHTLAATHASASCHRVHGRCVRS